MIEVKSIRKNYQKNYSLFNKNKSADVLEDVSFQLYNGECLGIIGESGSGKSTLSRILLGLETYNEGSIFIDNQPAKKWLEKNRGKFSVVFQDYRTSVNPNWTIQQILEEPMRLLKQSSSIYQSVILELLEKVQLSSELLRQYPDELSGGQLQRVCIARALTTKPKYLVLDEAISSLDVSVQSQILDLLVQLQKEFQLTYLFIAHDLMAVSSICDRIAFLRNGRIIEEIDCHHLNCATSDYAQSLLASVMDFHSEYKKEKIS